MIDFSLPPELEMVQETAHRFAREHLWPAHRRHESERRLAAGVLEAYGQTGLERIELPEDMGGAGLGSLARMLVLEELAGADAGAALALDRLGPALYPLLELGDGRMVCELALPLLERDGARAVLAYDGDGRIRIEGDRAWGTIDWLPSDRVDLLVVLQPQGVGVATGEFALEAIRGAALRAAGACALRLDGTPLVRRVEDAAGASRALCRARLYVAALLVGVMRAAAEYSRAYALERVAFGRPIAHHQALAFLIADMATAVDAARLLLWKAAWQRDEGDDRAIATAAAAFAEAAEQAMFVTPNALQILGGHGFMQDHPVEKFLREARALSLMLGGLDAARDTCGRAYAAATGDL